MNYGIILMVFGLFDTLIIFSGLPTGWKKALILIISLGIILIGWIIYATAKHRKEKITKKKQVIEEVMHEDLSQITHAIAHDVQETVEQELEEITEAAEHAHHHHVFEEPTDDTHHHNHLHN